MKRFIDVWVPVTTCTLRCHYCYITHHRLFDSKLPKFKYSPETFRKGLSKERLGGVCMFNLCGGGETLLPPEMPKYIRALLEEGHYVMVVTNATVDKAFNEMSEWNFLNINFLFFLRSVRSFVMLVIGHCFSIWGQEYFINVIARSTIRLFLMMFQSQLNSKPLGIFVNSLIVTMPMHF